MSAVTVEDLGVAPAPSRWRHVERPVGVGRPGLRPAAPLSPGRRPIVPPPPVVVIRPAVPGAARPGLRLTRRGIAVVLGMFLSLCLTALVVLVTAFLAVSNEPVAEVGRLSTAGAAVGPAGH